MQTPIPVGPNPSLPAPIGPLSGFAGLSASSGVGVVLAADTTLTPSTLATIFGALTVGAGRYVVQAGLFVGSAAGAVTGLSFEIVSAAATLGLGGYIAPASSASTYNQSAGAVNGLIPPVGTVVTFDASGTNQYVSLSGSVVTPGGSIDLQGRVNGGVANYIIRAGSWITLTKVG